METRGDTLNLTAQRDRRPSSSLCASADSWVAQGGHPPRAPSDPDVRD